MKESGEVRDDHYWDVLAQRQFNNVIDWLRDFVDPQFRKRVWQEGTSVGQLYEETAEQFFSDFSMEWLVDEDGLARLGAPCSMIDALRVFRVNYRAFDETLPQWIDAVELETNPAFQKVLAEAQSLLSIMEQSRSSMRQIEDDI